jgi:hypothetical protein
MIDYTFIIARAAARSDHRKDDSSVSGPLTETPPDCSAVWPGSAALPIPVSHDDEHC